MLAQYAQNPYEVQAKRFRFFHSADETTCELLKTYGYHATGLNQILAKSRTPKGSLYYYFPEGKEDLPPAALRSDSPYDPEAHYGNKRSQTWMGYKVHVTETCDDNEVHLITHVETTLAGMTDSELSAPIHEALAQRTLLPGEHFLDAGYVDADLLVRSQNELGIEVIGPVRPDSRGPGTSCSGLRCGSLSSELASTAGDLPKRVH